MRKPNRRSHHREAGTRREDSPPASPERGQSETPVRGRGQRVCRRINQATVTGKPDPIVTGPQSAACRSRSRAGFLPLAGNGVRLGEWLSGSITPMGDIIRFVR
jgi:hypothetical protein